MASHPTIIKAHKPLRMLVVLSMLFALFAPLAQRTASAASVSSASFTGDNKTLTVDGVLYAKKQAALTLAVTTATAAKCVVVSGDHTATQTDRNGKTSWSFSFTAGDGNGVKTVTINAYDNSGTPCTNPPGSHKSMDASYILDNTGPVATATLTPAANAAGWNKSVPVSIAWDATDAGVGFIKDCDGSDKTLNPCTDSVTAATAGVNKTTTATDQLGNEAKPAGSVTVRVDTTAPSISGSRSPAAPSSGWNNTDVTVSFTCADSGTVQSGIKSCGPNTTVSTEGSAQSVTGKAIDVADNEASATVGNINIDKTAPSVTGAATTSPNDDGWYKDDVIIAWTCSDALSGLNGACPANSTITGEGSNLGATSASVSDKAGNSGSGSVSGIKIDRTAPNTTATAPATDWNNVDVTVSLNVSDALSGVKSTHYKLDGGAQQSGTSVSISSEGVHTLEFWSVDNAGNAEAAKTVEVKIDKTKPSINHTQDPAANTNGWNNTNVQVTFTCTDGGSGLKSCTSPQTVTTEGKDQPVTGTAEDNAGNTATDPATVSIDKTPPTISASRDRAANSNGWYNDDVTVSFACDDKLSGIATCPAAETLGEGANQSVTGTATDAADNSASATESGINVDKTPPSLSGMPSTTEWSREDVTVAWTCSDALSGIAGDGSCPANSTVTGEGANLSASAVVSDTAGNTTHETVSGIMIDKTKPSTESDAPTGWQTSAVTVNLTPSDNLSGVKATYYKLNGTDQQEGTSVSISTEGTHTLEFWSVDNAGNSETPQSVTVKVDLAGPTVERDTAADSCDTPGSAGWCRGTQTAGFTASDALSGLADENQASFTKSTSDNGSAVYIESGSVSDQAGNTNPGITAGPFQIDSGAPSIEDKGVAVGTLGANGWYTSAVTNQFAASDEVSGLADPSQANFTQSSSTAEGSAVKINSGSVSDAAGNTHSGIDSAAFKIDLSNPSVAIASPADGSSTSDSSVSVSVEVSDLVSGIDSVTINGGSASLVSGNTYSRSIDLACGSNAITAVATDNAGRQSSAQISVTRTCVTWQFHGFYRPVDMGKDASGKDIYNTLKAGATAPLKFNIRNASGAELTDSSVVKARVERITCATGTTEDTLTETTSNPAGLHWDASAQQWVFNWGTKGLSAGTCYRIMITADGTAATAYPANNATLGNTAYFRLNK